MRKLKFLYIARGYEFIMPSVPLKLSQELGHDVVYYVVMKDDKGKQYEKSDIYEGMGIKIIQNEQEAQPYLNDKERIKVIEDTQLTKVAAPLIKAGHPVVGGVADIENWEIDRDKGMDICKRIEKFNEKFGNESYNIRMLDQEEFTDFDQAIQFVEQNPDRWVIKEAGDSDLRHFTYKGELDSGMDVIARLEHFREKGMGGDKKIHFYLQKRVKGVEIACSAFFNGNNFLNFTEIGFEHQPLLSGDRGPNSGEMLNQAWGLDKKDNILFQIIFKPLIPYLRKKNFKGFMDINGIIDERGYHPFEFTIRNAGAPWAAQLYELLYNKYDFGEFLADLAYGRDSVIKWNEGYCIGVRVDVPPTLFKGISATLLKKSLEEDKNLSKELSALLQNPEKLIERLQDFSVFNELSYEMPVIIDNFHDEKARHFHWTEAKNLRVEYRDNIAYGYVEPTGHCLCFITEMGKDPKTVDRRLDYIIESMAGLSFIARDDFDEPIEENLAKLEAWGYKLSPKL